MFDNGCENNRYIAFGAGLHDEKLATGSSSGDLQVRYLRPAYLIFWICKHRDDGGPRYQFQEKSKSLRCYLAAE